MSKRSVSKESIKDKKLKIVENVVSIPDEEVNEVYDLVMKKVKGIKTKPERKKIDRTTEKYQLLLELINGILENLEKDPIEDLRDFIRIDREDIIRDENKLLLEEMEDRITELFDKKKCGFYRKDRLQHFILTAIRQMCKELNLSFDFKKKDITINTIRKTHLLYSISDL